MTAYEQRSYPGAAADTLLNADLASNGLTFSVTPGTGNGYPTGGSGPFFIAIDYDTSKAEKIRVTSRINDTFTIATTADRGVDGTAAVAHSANAKVRAVWTATDAQEANRAAANTVGKVTTKGDLLAGTGANSLSRVGAGTDGSPLVADSTAPAGVAYRNTVSFDAAGHIITQHLSYTPTFYDSSGAPVLFSSGAVTGAYSKIGKIVNGVAVVVTGSGAFTTGHIYVDLPVAIGTAGQIVGTWSILNLGVGGFVVCTTVGATKSELLTTSFASYAGNPGAGNTLSVNFNYLANS